MLVSPFDIGLAIGLESDRFCVQFSAREQPVFDSRTLPQSASRREFSMMESPHNNHEFRFWLWWAPVRRRPAFLRRVAAAICLACWPNFEMLGPLLLELKRQHPQPPPGPASPDDPDLFGWLCWVSRGGSVPSFVRTLAEAAFCACAGDYELLRPVLLELKRRYPEA